MSRTGTGLVRTGAGRLRGWYVSTVVSSATVTLYDALSATGTPIEPAACPLLAGYISCGDTGIYLATGLFAVLSQPGQVVYFDFA